MRDAMKFVVAGIIAAGVILAAAAARAERTDEAPAVQASSTVYVGVRGGHGSGVHIGAGRFLTAAHVSEDETEVTIKDDQGVERKADVLWTSKPYDISLLRLTNKVVDVNIATAMLGCRALHVGEPIEATGSPMDMGLVRTFGRIARAKSEKNNDWKQAIIGDITIGPGMSGGPVFDASGNVIAFTVGMYVKSPFAILVPATVACDLLGAH